MIAVFLCLALTALVSSAVWALGAAGLRAGDRVGDTTFTAIESDGNGRGIRLTVHNAGKQAVLLGAFIRRRSLRLWRAAGYVISVPRRTSQERLLAGQHTVVYAVAAGEPQTVLVLPSAATRRRAQLVLAVG